MSIPLSKQQHNNNKRKRITRTISVTDALNKPKPFIKTVGRNSDNLGRIYLPGFWIGKSVKVSLFE
jgi:regulator of replication initiation timing